MEKKTDFHEFPNLRTANELESYISERTKGHNDFFHYTSLRSIDTILEKKNFIISSVDRFNDKKDGAQFGDELERKRYFSMCFSSGINENLALWYLYSGIGGKGGRLGFTSKRLSKMIDDGEFYLVEYDYKTHQMSGIEIPLFVGKNMKMEFFDVLYARHNRGNYVDLKYNTMTNYGKVSLSEFDAYKKMKPGFVKNSIWYHEKETRLLIKIIGETAKQIDPQKTYAVCWNFKEDHIKYMKIVCAPEIKTISELFEPECEYKSIKKFLIATSKISLSENAGDIEMNICSKCDYKEKFCSK